MTQTAATAVGTATGTIASMLWWQLLLLLIVSFSFILVIVLIIIKNGKVKVDPATGKIEISKEGEDKAEEVKPKAEEDKVNIQVTTNVSGVNGSVGGINPNPIALRKMDQIIKDTREFSEKNHSTCTLFNDFRFVISQSIDFGRELSIIEMNSIIRDQMTASQGRVDRIRNVFLKDFQDTLQVQDSSVAFLNNQSYILFDLILKEWEKSVLGELKRCYRENHLLEQSDEEFDEYVDDNTRRIVEQAYVYIGEMLPNFFDDNRKRLLDLYNKKQDKFFDIIKTCLYEARRITAEYNELITKKKKEFQEEIKNMTGIPQDVKIM